MKKKIFEILEKSYKIHWNLREDMAEFWRKNKDFIKLLDFSSKLLKQKYPELQ